MPQYCPGAKFSEQNRTLFAFASYNAGPGNISKMRREAEERGLDPDRWFNNVEIVTAEKIGRETTTCVRNIFKYYVSCKLTSDAREQAERLKNDVVTPKKWRAVPRRDLSGRMLAGRACGQRSRAGEFRR